MEENCNNLLNYIVPAFIGAITSLIGVAIYFWASRFSEKHVYGAAIFQEKLSMYQDIFHAVLELAIALDESSGKEECLANVKSKAANINRVATRHAGVISENVLSLCTGYYIAVNRARDLSAIEEFHSNINIYEVILLNARQELATTNLSEETLALLKKQPRTPRKRYKSYDKYVEKRTKETLDQLGKIVYPDNHY